MSDEPAADAPLFTMAKIPGVAVRWHGLLLELEPETVRGSYRYSTTTETPDGWKWRVQLECQVDESGRIAGGWSVRAVARLEEPKCSVTVTLAQDSNETWNEALGRLRTLLRKAEDVWM